VHNPVNSAISFGLLIAVVGGSFYYVYAFTPRGPWLGISAGGFLDSEAAGLLGLDQEQGYLIFTVEPSGPASKAGLRGGSDDIVLIGDRPIPIDGDIIVSMDDRQINVPDDVCSVLDQKQVGDTVRIAAIRDGSLQEFNLVLEEAPPGQSSRC
jgi:S1-C subfamily serine protease